MLPKQAQHFYFGDCVAHQRKYLWNILKFIFALTLKIKPRK